MKPTPPGYAGTTTPPGYAGTTTASGYAGTTPPKGRYETPSAGQSTPYQTSETNFNFTCPLKRHPYIHNYLNSNQFTLVDNFNNNILVGLKCDESIFKTTGSKLFIKRTFPTDLFVFISLAFRTQNVQSLKISFLDRFNRVVYQQTVCI